jgi:lantibiotic modifying enzyme
MLPAEAMLRAKWPWEHDSSVDVTNLLKIEYLQGASSAASAATVAQSIKRIRKASAQPELDSPDIGDTRWVDFLETLVVPEAGVKQQTRFLAHILQNSDVKNNPYSVPFNTLTLNNLLGIHRLLRHQFDEERLNEIYHTLANWYVSSAIRCSQYALHVTYKQSGLTWKMWSRQFESKSLTENPWLDIATEFPVLLRRLSTIQQNASAALQELFERLKADRTLLFEYFQIPISAKVTAIEPGLSDPHRLGRTVFKLVFGNTGTLYYKPKPVDIELAFNEFVRNEKPTGLRHIEVLPRSSYGWVESAGDQIELQPLAFPENVGAATPCFWLLNATDLHAENIFTDKSGVLAVDLETLLTAPVKSLDSNAISIWRKHSINATLLFNARVGPDNHIANISGFDASPEYFSLMPQVHFILKDNDIQLVKNPANIALPSLPKRGNQNEKDAIRKTIDSFKNTLSTDNIVTQVSEFKRT